MIDFVFQNDDCHRDRVIPPDGQQAKAIAEMVRQFGLRRVAIVYCTGDVYCAWAFQMLSVCIHAGG